MAGDPAKDHGSQPSQEVEADSALGVSSAVEPSAPSPSPAQDAEVAAQGPKAGGGGARAEDVPQKVGSSDAPPARASPASSRSYIPVMNTSSLASSRRLPSSTTIVAPRSTEMPSGGCSVSRETVPPLVTYGPRDIRPEGDSSCLSGGYDDSSSTNLSSAGDSSSLVVAVHEAGEFARAGDESSELLMEFASVPNTLPVQPVFSQNSQLLAMAEINQLVEPVMESLLNDVTEAGGAPATEEVRKESSDDYLEALPEVPSEPPGRVAVQGEHTQQDITHLEKENVKEPTAVLSAHSEESDGKAGVVISNEVFLSTTNSLVLDPGPVEEDQAAKAASELHAKVTHTLQRPTSAVPLTQASTSSSSSSAIKAKVSSTRTPSKTQTTPAKRLSSARLGGSTGSVASMGQSGVRIAGPGGRAAGQGTGLNSQTSVKGPSLSFLKAPPRPSSARSNRSVNSMHGTTVPASARRPAQAKPTGASVPAGSDHKATSNPATAGPLKFGSTLASASRARKPAVAPPTQQKDVKGIKEIKEMRDAKDAKENPAALSNKSKIINDRHFTPSGAALSRSKTNQPGREPSSLSASDSPQHVRTKEREAQLLKQKVLDDRKETLTMQKAGVERFSSVSELRAGRMARGGSMAASGAGEETERGSSSTGSLDQKATDVLAMVEEKLKALVTLYRSLAEELGQRYDMLLKDMRAAGGDDVIPGLADQVAYAETVTTRLSEARLEEDRHMLSLFSKMRIALSESCDERALLETENTELVDKLAECTRDLEQERAVGAKAKSIKATLDVSLKQMRSKLGAAEAKAMEDEARIKEQLTQINMLQEKARSQATVQKDLEKKWKQALKEAEILHAKLSERSKKEHDFEAVKQQYDSKLESVKKMLHIETKSRERAEQKLKEFMANPADAKAGAQLVAELNATRAERDQLKKQLQTASENASVAVQGKLKEVTALLEESKKQIHAKDTELRRLIASRPNEPSPEEVQALRDTLADLVTHNERLEHELSMKVQEIAKRDKLMMEQEKVLYLRDRLIDMLHGGQSQDQASRQHNSEVLNGRQLVDVYATLERKQVHLKALESEVQRLQKQQDSQHNQRTRMEQRIAQLEHQLAMCSQQRGVLCSPRWACEQ